MNYCRLARIITMTAVAAVVCVSGLTELNARDVYAADATQGMTPEQLAQELARQEEIAKAAQAARAQAETDAAVLAAQAKAQQQEASDLYLQWGTAAGTYIYTPEVSAFINGNQPAVAPGTAAASANAILNKAVSLPNVAKINPSSMGIKTVDLIVFAGQSNMSGAGGNGVLASKVAPNAGFEFRSSSDPTGFYPITEPFGARENGYLSDPAVLRGGSLVSSFISTYYSRTGTPVVAVSASRGGSDSAYWASAGVRQDLLSKYLAAKNYLTANGYTIRHRYLVFLQGESDSNGKVTPAQYTANLEAAFSGVFNAGLEQVFIITPGHAQGGIVNYDEVVATQEKMCAGSNKYTLASELLRTLPLTAEYMADAVHYNQKALNMVGANAAARVAMGY